MKKIIVIMILVQLSIFAQKEAKQSKSCDNGFSSVCNVFSLNTKLDMPKEIVEKALISDISKDILNSQKDIKKMKDLVTNNVWVVIAERFSQNSIDLNLYSIFLAGIHNDVNNHLFKKILSTLEKAKEANELLKKEGISIENIDKNLKELIDIYTGIQNLIAKVDNSDVTVPKIKASKDIQIESIKLMKDIQKSLSKTFLELKSKNQTSKTIDNSLNTVAKSMETIIEMTEICVDPFKPIVKGYYTYVKNDCMLDSSNMKALDICRNFLKYDRTQSVHRDIFILNRALEVLNLYKSENLEYYKKMEIFKNILVALVTNDKNLLHLSFINYLSISTVDNKIKDKIISTLLAK
ncbi:hypothetical protein JXR93_13735 [bacterium]|nr:hypothetical protein [bacterium]